MEKLRKLCCVGVDCWCRTKGARYYGESTGEGVSQCDDYDGIEKHSA